MTTSGIKTIRTVFCATLTSLVLAACGGGGEATSSDNPTTPPTAGQTATVGVLITDAPSLDIDAALATITSIELLGDAGRAVVFSGEETIDLLRLADAYELFAIDDVRAGTYNKVRLIVSRLVLVKKDDMGNVVEEIEPKLPGNGKIDLNPRGGFFAAPGAVLFIEIDVDMEKSLKLTTTGNGKVKFRPVIFVRILTREPPAGKLARVHGEIDELADDGSFRLCQTRLIAKSDRDNERDHFEHCIRVFTDENTGFFDSDGLPTEFSALMDGDEVTVAGRIRRHRGDANDADDVEDDERLALDGFVVEIGPPGTFRRWAGTIASTVDPDTARFKFGLAPGQGFTGDSGVDTQLYDQTRIFSRAGVELDVQAIRPDRKALIDGILRLSDTEGNLLRAALVVLELDDTIEDVLSGQVLSVDADTGTLRMTTEGGDRCVIAGEADIFVVSFGDDGFDSRRGELEELVEGQRIAVFGTEDSGGCFLARTIIAEAVEDQP